MSTASQSAGGKGGSGKPGASPRAEGEARPKETAGHGTAPAKKSAAKTAAKAAPKRASARSGAARPATAASPDSNGGNSDSGKKSPAKESASPAGEKQGGENTPAKGGGKGGGELPGGGNGSGPSGNGPGGIDLPWDVPWARLGLYGLAGLAGGALVAVILLLTDAPGGLKEQVQAPERRIENAEVASGDPKRVAPEVPVRGNELRANLEQIGEELVRLDTKLSKLAGDVTRTRAQLSGRLESLEAATPEELPKLLDRWSGTVRKLENRLAQLERDEMTRDVRRASLALALANLTRATETSQPFVNELKAIEVLDPGNRLVEALKPYAQSGLPSVPNLAGRFDKVADDVMSVWRREHGRGFFEWLWDSIVGLFSVRPVGEVEGEKAPAIVARAEQRLKEGELHLAVEELAKLGEKEQAAAAEWLEAARARIRLDTLVAEVNRSVLEEIAEAAAERKAREAGFVPAEQNGESPQVRPAPKTEDGEPEMQGGADGASER